jgi:hypothetical protein
VPLPFHKVNVLTGLRTARTVEDGSAAAEIIKKAARPLLVLGALTVRDSQAGRPLIWPGPGRYRSAPRPTPAGPWSNAVSGRTAGST